MSYRKFQKFKAALLSQREYFQINQKTIGGERQTLNHLGAKKLGCAVKVANADFEKKTPQEIKKFN